MPNFSNEVRLYNDAGERLYLNASERKQFGAVARTREPRIASFCLTLLNTGCRLSEGRHIDAGHFQAAEAILPIRTLKRKGWPVREFPLTYAFAAELDGLLTQFGGDVGLPWSVSRTTAWRWIVGVMKEARISGVHATPKGLRHGFVVNSVMQGIPPRTVQAWAGHARIETTFKYYSIISGPEERILAERLVEIG